MEPQSDHGGQEQQTENDIEPMFLRRFRRRLVVHAPYQGDVHFFVHRGEGQSGQPFAVWRRSHQADADQYQAADREHDDGIVQEVHGHQPADCIRRACAAGVFQLKDEPHRAQHKPGEQ